MARPAVKGPQNSTAAGKLSEAIESANLAHTRRLFKSQNTRARFGRNKPAALPWEPIRLSAPRAPGFSRRDRGGSKRV